jgi:hypothetical protein
MRTKQLVVSCCFLLALSSAALGQKVAVDWDKGATFTGFKTYSWIEGTPAQNPLMANRIVEAIDAQLAAKGLQKVAPGANPDVVVAYHAGRDTETRINTVDTGMYGGGWGYWGGYYGGGSSTTYVDKVQVGQLIVDIGDVKTKKYVWRATANATIPSKPEKGEALISKAVTKMFEKFPPPPAKK